MNQRENNISRFFSFPSRLSHIIIMAFSLCLKNCCKIWMMVSAMRLSIGWGVSSSGSMLNV